MMGTAKVTSKDAYIIGIIAMKAIELKPLKSTPLGSPEIKAKTNGKPTVLFKNDKFTQNR